MITQTALLTFFLQHVGEGFFNRRFETSDSLISLYKYVSENQSLCVNIYLANVMHSVSFRENPLSTLCIK